MKAVSRQGISPQRRVASRFSRCWCAWNRSAPNAPPPIQLVHFRVEKPINLAKGHKIVLWMNVYNLANSNTALTLTQQSGASYQVPPTILSPRIVEFGVSYTFSPPTAVFRSRVAR